MFSISGWVRSVFRDSALAGVQDAMRVLTPEGEDPPADLAELRQRLAAAVQPKQLAAAKGDDDEPAKTRKK